MQNLDELIHESCLLDELLHFKKSQQREESMKLGKFIFLFISLSSLNCLAEPSILNRATKVQSKLEVLNNLGRQCEAELQVKGLKGGVSETCTKYLKNINGSFFESIGTECVALSNWYESKRKMIISNPNYADQHPEDASELVRDMKSVQKTCNPKNMASYTYLTKPLDTINALKELE